MTQHDLESGQLIYKLIYHGFLHNWIHIMGSSIPLLKTQKAPNPSADLWLSSTLFAFQAKQTRVKGSSWHRLQGIFLINAAPSSCCHFPITTENGDPAGHEEGPTTQTTEITFRTQVSKIIRLSACVCADMYVPLVPLKPAIVS